MPAKRTVLLLALTLSGIAVAQPKPPAPPALPAPAAKGKLISVQFQGTLKDALREIAQKGGINLVVTGNLNDLAEVHLTNVSAEQALDVVAEVHHLKVGRQGSIWTMRPMNDDEIEEVADAEEEARDAAAEAAEEAADARQEAEEARQEALEAAKDAAREVGRSGEVQKELEELIQQKLQDRLSRLDRKFSSVGGDFTGMGDIVVREDQRVKNAVSYGGSVEVYGRVDQDAVAFGGPIKLGPKAVVGGDVVAFGGPIEKADGAIVEGDTVSMGGGGPGLAVSRALRHSHGPDSVSESADGASRSGHSRQWGLPDFFLWFAVLFGVGFMARMWAPNRMKLLEGEIKRGAVRCMLTGLVGALALSLMTALMAVTIVGIPFAVATWVLGAVGVAMGLAALASEIGMALPLTRIRKTQAVVLALGLLVLLVAAKIPFVGTFVLIATLSLSLGAIIRTRFGSRGEGMPERM